MREKIQNALDALAAQRQVPDLAGCATAIKRHHGLATKMADEAVRHAREAGWLLLEVKAALGHGQFGAWCRESLRFSQRTCERYMRACRQRSEQHRVPTPKSDSLTKLTASTPVEPPEHLKEAFRPDWAPTPGHWHFAVTSDATVWVVPDAGDPGLFHVSRLYQRGDESLFDGTHMPIEAWLVEDFLRLQFGTEDPWLLPWKSRLKPGLARPFGEPGHA